MSKKSLSLVVLKSQMMITVMTAIEDENVTIRSNSGKELRIRKI